MNINPIFPGSPNVGMGPNTTATTNKDGTAADIVTIFTAGVNGSYVRKIRLTAMATTVGGIGRFWLNNGSDHTSAANNTLIAMKDLPTVADIDAGAVTEIDIEINEAIPANWKIYMGVAGLAAASVWQATVYGGDY